MDTTARNDLIQELRRNGATLEQIADRVGLSTQQVCRIVQTKGRQDEEYIRSGRGQGMPCPECGGHSRTTRTYPPSNGARRRHHRCLNCDYDWFSEQKNLPKKSLVLQIAFP